MADRMPPREIAALCACYALTAAAFLLIVYAPELIAWRRSWLP